MKQGGYILLTNLFLLLTLDLFVDCLFRLCISDFCYYLDLIDQSADMLQEANHLLVSTYETKLCIC